MWDVHPGYLNRQSLLGEHRELHGLRNILLEGKRGYARHPETLRWVGCLSALARRHAALAAEMRLRGYEDRTPVAAMPGRTRWPSIFITEPAGQLALLRLKYAGKDPGRIPLPRNAQDLWAHYKYSVMARDPDLCRRLARRAARMPRHAGLDALAAELVDALHRRPSAGRLAHALHHMWGHVADDATPEERAAAARGGRSLIDAIRTAALRQREPYLMASTALSDLACQPPAHPITRSPDPLT